MTINAERKHENMKNKRQSTIKVLIRVPMQPYSEVIPNTISKIIHDIEKEHGATHALEYEIQITAF